MQGCPGEVVLLRLTLWSGTLQGVRASDRALSSYCALHRLSLALVEDFRLLPSVLHKLDRFQTSKAARLKAEVPALGSLLALLSLTPASRHSWNMLVCTSLLLIDILDHALDASLLAYQLACHASMLMPGSRPLPCHAEN